MPQHITDRQSRWQLSGPAPNNVGSLPSYKATRQRKEGSGPSSDAGEWLVGDPFKAGAQARDDGDSGSPLMDSGEGEDMIACWSLDS